MQTVFAYNVDTLHSFTVLSAMALAIFDLDNTLLAGDSDYLWGQYISENNYVDAESYQQTNQAFYDQYVEGTMDIFEFLAFQFKPLADNSLETLYHWRQDYLQKKIDPIILPAAHELINKHRNQGDILIIISATNDFITAPIAEKLGVENLIATQAEMADGRYTGKVEGTPSYQQGKVTRLQAWLAEHKLDMAGSYFYSDSHNDLPLLKQADNPIAVDPDPQLLEFAEQANWPIISLR